MDHSLVQEVSIRLSKTKVPFLEGRQDHLTLGSVRCSEAKIMVRTATNIFPDVIDKSNTAMEIESLQSTRSLGWLAKRVK